MKPKSAQAIPVPLNGEAVAILQKQIDKHRDVVFTFKGQAVEQLSTAAWYKALRRATHRTQARVAKEDFGGP
jgi:hypothetical protein